MKQALNKKNMLFYITLVIVVILFFLFRGIDKKPFEGLVHTVFSPFTRFFSNAEKFSRDRISFFGSIGSLKSNNEDLFEENLELKSQIAKLQDIKKENEELRNQLKLAPYEEYDLTASMVVGRDISGATNVFVIDVGSSDGVEQQMAVIVGEGVLVGKVTKVLQRSAYFELIKSKNSRVNAEIIESGAKGIVRGQFETGAILDMIPQTVEVKKGDTVITSGVGNILPRGLLIGYAHDVTATADRLFQQVSLISPINYESIRMVWIVKGAKIQ